MSMSFEIGFEMAITGLLEGAVNGMGQAVNEFMGDAIVELPRIPRDEGTLAGSASCFVDGDLVAIAQNVGGTPDPLTQDPLHEGPSQETISGRVFFNSPYAAYQHEGVRKDGTHQVANYTNAGTGPKFLERPASEQRDIYMGIVAANMQGPANG